MKNLTLVGHLGKDAVVLPKKNKTDKFNTIFFSLAVTEKYKDSDNQEVVKTDWFSCFKKYNSDPKKVVEILKTGLKVCVIGKPSFSIRNESAGVFLDLTLNISNLDFMSKK